MAPSGPPSGVAQSDTGVVEACAPVLLRPVGRRLFGVPLGPGSPRSHGGGPVVVVGPSAPRDRQFVASVVVGRRSHAGPSGWVGPALRLCPPRKRIVR